MKNITGKGIISKKGLSLVELMIASAIFLVAFVGILASYLACLELSELSKNSSIALHATKARLEAIKNTAFIQIKATYNNAPFAVASFNGMGVSYVDDTNPNLLKVTLSFSWKQPRGRIIGEDINLNGVVNAGEDKNANGILSSPVELVTYIFE